MKMDFIPRPVEPAPGAFTDLVSWVMREMVDREVDRHSAECPLCRGRIQFHRIGTRVSFGHEKRGCLGGGNNG